MEHPADKWIELTAYDHLFKASIQEGCVYTQSSFFLRNGANVEKKKSADNNCPNSLCVPYMFIDIFFISLIMRFY